MNNEFARLQRQYGRSFSDKYEHLRDYVAEIRANLRDHSQHDAEVLDNTHSLISLDLAANLPGVQATIHRLVALR